MYCPNCAAEENQPKQFCRNCGTDLRSVRTALENPALLTAFASSTREEVGSAVALKIKELQSSRDLKRITEEVLPQLSKFLESPEEKRLRSIRSGVITTAVGIGIFILFSIVGRGDLSLPAFAGILPFLIGIGMIVNGIFFTVPRGSVAGPESASNFPPVITKELMTDATGSVIEHTTHRLPEQNIRG